MSEDDIDVTPDEQFEDPIISVGWPRAWITPEVISKMGTMTDGELAEKVGVSHGKVWRERRRRSIPPHRIHRGRGRSEGLPGLSSQRLSERDKEIFASGLNIMRMGPSETMIWKHERKRLGMCVDCNQPAVPKKIRCEVDLLRDRMRYRKMVK